MRIREGHTAAQPLFLELLLKSTDSSTGDLTASTRIAASSGRLFRRFSSACAEKDARKLKKLRETLKANQFSTARVAEALKVDDWQAAAPLFAMPASAGSVKGRLPFQDCTTHEMLISMFILGLAVPLEQVCVEAKTTIDLLLDLELIDHCEVNADILVPLVAITPVNPGLFFVTDWHPHVLGLVQIDEIQQPVMYIGPDSLALVEMWQPRVDGTLLDLCTGSGVQGLYQVAVGTFSNATLVDVNPRATRFAEFNAALNGLQSKVAVDQCDICSANTKRWLGSTAVSANPPFLPVPERDTRHGLYSVGGPSGDRLLFAAIEVAQAIGARETAIVSEFFFGHDDSYFKQRVRKRWSGHGILLTNEYALSAREYALRRADSSQEAEIWLNHLRSQDIEVCSPGLLFLDQSSTKGNQLKHVKVPRSKLGSIWTPGNYVACQFCKAMTSGHFS